METKIYAKCIDQDVRLALYGMLEYAAVKLFPRRMKNTSINLHLKHHDWDGEAMIMEGYTGRHPRDFKIVIDPYRIMKDDWDRELNYSEWVSKLLRTLAHEMVHVKQYIMGELTYKRGAMCWNGKKVGWMSGEEYYCSPHEVEAYGKEKWLQLGYTVVWNKIKQNQ